MTTTTTTTTTTITKPQPVTDVFADCKSPVTRKEYPKRLKAWNIYNFC